jgi:hypothetical protein
MPRTVGSVARVEGRARAATFEGKMNWVAHSALLATPMAPPSGERWLALRVPEDADGRVTSVEWRDAPALTPLVLRALRSVAWAKLGDDFSENVGQCLREELDDAGERGRVAVHMRKWRRCQSDALFVTVLVDDGAGLEFEFANELGTWRGDASNPFARDADAKEEEAAAEAEALQPAAERAEALEAYWASWGCADGWTLVARLNHTLPAARFRSFSRLSNTIALSDEGGESAPSEPDCADPRAPPSRQLTPLPLQQAKQPPAARAPPPPPPPPAQPQPPLPQQQQQPPEVGRTEMTPLFAVPGSAAASASASASAPSAAPATSASSVAAPQPAPAQPRAPAAAAAAAAAAPAPPARCCVIL